MLCGDCRGEGRRSQPPYDVKHPDRPLRWRAKEDCDRCDGTGYRPATTQEVHEHARLGAVAPRAAAR